ncbi:LiaF domain-containing protein, partial [Pasteurella multocida]
SSAVFIGDINLIGSKKSGLSTKVYAASTDFSESKRRVKVSVSLFIGDVDVKYV